MRSICLLEFKVYYYICIGFYCVWYMTIWLPWHDLPYLLRSSRRKFRLPCTHSKLNVHITVHPGLACSTGGDLLLLLSSTHFTLDVPD